MGKTFQRPAAFSDQATHYCPGCTRGVAHRLVAEVIDELGIHGRTVGIAPVEAVEWAEENMLKYYPLGELKTPDFP